MMSSISCADLLGLGGGEVDLVDDRHDLMVVLDRLVDVGERLRLDPLRRVDDQQRAFAGGEAAADLIGEVDVAGRVHQVELVGLAVRGLPLEAHGLRLDGDPALLLDLHIVEHLAARHLALGQAAGALDQPVGKRRLAMVDMGDDARNCGFFRGRVKLTTCAGGICARSRCVQLSAARGRISADARAAR